MAKEIKPIKVVVVILTKKWYLGVCLFVRLGWVFRCLVGSFVLVFFAYVAYFTSKMWNKVTATQICQNSLVHVRRILWSLRAKVSMINKVLLSRELASLVSGFKIFWLTMEQLSRGEKNILCY